MRRRRSERGASTLLVVSVAGLLLWLGAALGVVAAMVADHRTAQAAADLAALSAATRLAGGGDGCAEAAAVATANGASLTACSVDGREVRVAVEVAGPRWLGQTGDLTAEARAGPAP
jgi:secretion/DNA translocation related TadE-like protein